MQIYPSKASSHLAFRLHWRLGKLALVSVLILLSLIMLVCFSQLRCRVHDLRRRGLRLSDNLVPSCIYNVPHTGLLKGDKWACNFRPPISAPQN